MLSYIFTNFHANQISHRIAKNEKCANMDNFSRHLNITQMLKGNGWGGILTIHI